MKLPAPICNAVLIERGGAVWQLKPCLAENGRYHIWTRCGIKGFPNINVITEMANDKALVEEKIAPPQFIRSPASGNRGSIRKHEDLVRDTLNKDARRDKTLQGSGSRFRERLGYISYLVTRLTLLACQHIKPARAQAQKGKMAKHKNRHRIKLYIFPVPNSSYTKPFKAATTRE